MRLFSKMASLLIAMTLVLGCSSGKAPAPSSESGHTGHSASAVDPHAGHNMGTMRSNLMVDTDFTKVAPGDVFTLRLMIHGPDGKAVREFEPLHEKLVHLIIVRDSLDQFAHLHPTMNADGSMTAEYTFPAAGFYHLFADHKPTGSHPALAVGKVAITGDAPPAEPLVPNVPGKVAADQLRAEIDVANAKVGTETGIAFTLHDEQDTAIADLQPYLGAMGHLVIISADAAEYVHAHPAESSTSAAAEGRVLFEAHFAKPGIYKAWGQFQRAGKILTVPFVIKVE